MTAVSEKDAVICIHDDYCIDIERLSRGSSLESGYIMQVLQTNNCKIITPSKIYDLQNESDEQFTDMKL